MTETLSAIFQRTHGAPIEMNGHMIVPIYKVTLGGGRTSLVVRRLESGLEPVSGLRIKAVNGEIEVNNQIYPEIILWSDTSPKSVPLIIRSELGCDLKIWNVWRAGETVQAWVGDAGIVVSQSSGVVRLECSGGEGRVNFSALIVEIDQIE